MSECIKAHGILKEVYVEVDTKNLGACEELLLRRILCDALEVWRDCIVAESVGE